MGDKPTKLNIVYRTVLFRRSRLGTTLQNTLAVTNYSCLFNV